MRRMISIGAITTIALSLGACMDIKNALDMPDGKSEKSSISTDANGTVTKRESSTETGLDADGNQQVITKTKTTNDPKGLFNKSTTSQTRQTSPY